MHVPFPFDTVVVQYCVVVFFFGADFRFFPPFHFFLLIPSELCAFFPSLVASCMRLLKRHNVSSITYKRPNAQRYRSDSVVRVKLLPDRFTKFSSNRTVNDSRRSCVFLANLVFDLVRFALSLLFG